MVMPRKDMLKLASGAIVMAAAGGVWRADAAAEYGSGPQFEPWRTWREDPGRGPLVLVRAAILSSNAYNTQPWLFHVTGSRIDVYADTRRNLGAFDPYLREMYFSLGCAIENLILAAQAEGYAPSLTLMPGTLAPPLPNLPHEHVARVELAADKRRASVLYDAIPHRHTNRDPFEATKPVPRPFIAALSEIAEKEPRIRLFLYTDEPDRKKIVDAIAKAGGNFMSDPNVRLGTSRWIRTTQAQVQDLRDGLFIDVKAAKPASLQSYADLMLTGRLFGLIAVRNRYDWVDTMNAGRIWQRAHLLATAHGLAARPANGAVELIDHERSLRLQPRSAAELTTLTGDASWQPTFMFYMGFATIPARASARRPVEELQV